MFHDSLLPKYRGFAPLVKGLICGETRFGVTALFGASQYDAGDILFQASVGITYPIAISDLITRVADCYVTGAVSARVCGCGFGVGGAGWVWVWARVGG